MMGSVWIISKGANDISGIVHELAKVEGNKQIYDYAHFGDEKIPLNFHLKKISLKSPQKTLVQDKTPPMGFYWIDYEYYSDEYILPVPLQQALQRKYPGWNIHQLPLILRENLFIIITEDFLFLLGRKWVADRFINQVLEGYLGISNIPVMLEIKSNLRYQDLTDPGLNLYRAKFEFKDSVLIYIRKDPKRSAGQSQILKRISEEYHRITGQFTVGLDNNLSYAFVYNKNRNRKRKGEFKSLESYVYSPNFPNSYLHERDPNKLKEVGLKLALISSGLSSILGKLEKEDLLRIIS